MVSPTIKEYVSLALIYALPEYFLEGGHIKPGREKGLLESVKRSIEHILGYYPGYDDAMRDQMAEILDRFNGAAFGRKKSRHQITMICFCLDLAEGLLSASPWPRTTPLLREIDTERARGLHKAMHALNELYIYRERHNRNAGIMAPCTDAGKSLAEKWEAIING